MCFLEARRELSSPPKSFDRRGNIPLLVECSTFLNGGAGLAKNVLCLPADSDFRHDEAAEEDLAEV